jgi:hypothetical protein
MSGKSKNTETQFEPLQRGKAASDAARVEKMREANRDWKSRAPRREGVPPATTWKRESWTLPREEARKQARAFLKKYPRAAYWSEVESWRVLEGDLIEFTMRRLPTAD